MKLHKAVLVVALLAAVVIIGVLLPVRQWFTVFEAYVHSLGTVGPVIFALGYVVLTVLLFPASFVTLGAGTLFGLKIGLLVALVGANLGALCSFLLARTFLREKVVLWTLSNPKFRFLDQAIGKQGFKTVLLCRLSPIFPFILLNYFLGLTAVRTGAYILANLFGMVPAMFLFVYAGAAAHDAVAGAAGASVGFYEQTLKYVGLLATFAVFVVVTRTARKALREAEQVEEGSLVSGKPRLDREHKPISYKVMTLADDDQDKHLIENCHPPQWANPTPAKKYNLVVLGGGTAGLVSAAGAAGLGAKVAIVERNLLGGDCLNVGCVPSKAIIRTARLYAEMRRAEHYGAQVPSGVNVDFAAVMQRMRVIQARISRVDSVRRLVEAGVDVFFGEARFTGP